jgi:hypothetical protein
MTSAIPGIVTVILITLGAGIIAYIGDRVGHQVGRRRLTLFGLRPKYTSTIVAVSTGMLIALTLTLAALAASQYVRQAVFRITALNDRINELQDQATRQQAELGTTRTGQIVLPIGFPLTTQFLTLKASQPQAEQRRALAEYFDDTVRSINAIYARPPYRLRPYEKTSRDKSVEDNFGGFIKFANDEQAGKIADAIVILPLAYQNLFSGDRIDFILRAYADRLIARKGETLASVDVRGGDPNTVETLITDLARRAAQTAVDRNMPQAFVATPFLDRNQVQDVVQDIVHMRGRFRIVAKASRDIYPHTGALLLDFAVVGVPKK